MSWHIINQILNTAATDPDFCQAILEHPLQTIEQRNWLLTPEERAILASIHAHDLAEFSEQLLQSLPANEKPPL